LKAGDGMAQRAPENITGRSNHAGLGPQLGATPLPVLAFEAISSLDQLEPYILSDSLVPETHQICHGIWI